MTNPFFKTLAKVSGIKVNAWNDRFYVNFAAAAQSSCRGDRTTKVWIKDNVLTIDAGRGSHSNDFSDALDALIAAITSAGAVRKGYSDTVSATFTLPTEKEES